MNARHALFAILICLVSVGCQRGPGDGPPVLRLDNDQCDQCGMIISDERFAAATIITGDRGPEPLLFDDYNCQVNYEVEHPDAQIEARWVHDYDTSDWLNAEAASFIMSSDLRTPMGSNTAAFVTPEAAQAARDRLGGDSMTFKITWSRLGFKGACCPTDKSEIAPEGENHVP